MIEESAKSRPLAKFGRVNAATKGKNADNLILISLLEMAAWKKGGVVMKDLPDPTRRWSRRSVAEWADMLKLHFDSAKRALRNLANHNLIEKHVFTHQNGAKVLLVRPTQRALGIWGGQGDKFEGDNELDFGRFMRRGRGRFPCAAKYGGEFLHGPGLAGT